MTTETKRTLGVVGLRTLSVASSVGLPVAAVLQQFPFFKENVTARELSAGGIMVILILLFGLRRQLWPMIKEKLHINSAGALIGWGITFAVLLWLEQLATLLPALRSICLAGLVGTGIGQVADTAAGFIKRKEVVVNA